MGNIRYSDLTSHQTVAEAFIKELLRTGQTIVSDHVLLPEDLLTICQKAMDQTNPGAVVAGGRQLRGRISEQLSRADRYNEPFSILALRIENADDRHGYEALVDTLCERMRNTDLMFLFKSRIVLILPYTTDNACRTFSRRVKDLLDTSLFMNAGVRFSCATYPSDEFSCGFDVLDWTEDMLR